MNILKTGRVLWLMIGAAMVAVTALAFASMGRADGVATAAGQGVGAGRVEFTPEQQEHAKQLSAAVRWHEQRAIELLLVGRAGDAEDAARTALAINPGHGDGVRPLLAETLLRQNKFAEALSVLETMKPSHLQTRESARIGLLLLEVGRIEESVASWNALQPDILKAVRRESEFREALPVPTDARSLRAAWQLGIALIEHRPRADFAQYYYLRAHEFMPENELLNLNLGRLLLHHGKPEEAIPYLQRAAARGVGALKAGAESSLRAAVRARSAGGGG